MSSCTWMPPSAGRSKTSNCARKKQPRRCTEKGRRWEIRSSVKTIKKLQSDVLKQADIARPHRQSQLLRYLCGGHAGADGDRAFFADRRGTDAAEQGRTRSAASANRNADDNVGILFNVDKLNDCVTHANYMTNRYGVEILSVNIISRNPLTLS